MIHYSMTLIDQHGHSRNIQSDRDDWAVSYIRLIYDAQNELFPLSVWSNFVMNPDANHLILNVGKWVLEINTIRY